MRKILISVLISSVQILAIAASAKPLPFFDARELTPFWPGEKEARALEPAVVKSFKVVDQNGRAVDEKTMQQKPSIVNFFFAECPNLCPTMMKSLQRFQSKLGPLTDSVKIFSFSVQPDKDTPEKLKSYAKAYGLNLDNWELLTGNREVIYHIGKEVFKADGSVGAQKSETSFIHTRNAYLVDGKLRIRGIYDTSSSADMELLARDLARLNADAD